MGNEPLAVTLVQQDGESRWTGSWLAVFHASEFVEPSHHDGIVVDYDSPAILDDILVAAAGELEVGEIGANGVLADGDRWAVRAEKNGFGSIEGHDRVDVIRGVGGSKLVESRIGIFRWTGERTIGRDKNQRGGNERSAPPGAGGLGEGYFD